MKEKICTHPNCYLICAPALLFAGAAETGFFNGAAHSARPSISAWHDHHQWSSELTVPTRMNGGGAVKVLSVDGKSYLLSKYFFTKTEVASG